MEKRNKKAAMELSFGMIFSIILIIAFIAFAFIAIKALLKTNDQAKIASFVDGLRADVDKVWRASQASQKVSYNLPGKIEEICFVDHTDFGESLILAPNDFDFPPIKIDHIDFEKTLANNAVGVTTRDGEKILCISNDGKVEMTLYKNYGEDLVTIKK
ncbi:MAG: hypothetical protein AABW50_00775 [Nanoarchaeota archaeon]